MTPTVQKNGARTLYILLTASLTLNLAGLIAAPVYGRVMAHVDNGDVHEGDKVKRERIQDEIDGSLKPLLVELQHIHDRLDELANRSQ